MGFQQSEELAVRAGEGSNQWVPMEDVQPILRHLIGGTMMINLKKWANLQTNHRMLTCISLWYTFGNIQQKRKGQPL